MTKIVKANLWDSGADLICVTTNGTLDKHGHLVMGVGAAGEAEERFPELSGAVGYQITSAWDVFGRCTQIDPKEDVYLYGCFIFPIWKVGVFQVKYHWQAPAKLSLIGYSITSLNSVLPKKYKEIALNFPGIGYGGLPREAVLPLLDDLDPRVTIYEYPDR